MNTVHECRIMKLPQILRREGNLTPITGRMEIPFDVARVYYLYDIPGGESRGGHAHRALEQLIISVMGSFEVVLDDGSDRRTVRLDRAFNGLYMPNMIWRELVDFSSGAVCLVLASRRYEESDYIRDYQEFRRLKIDST